MEIPLAMLLLRDKQTERNFHHRNGLASVFIIVMFSINLSFLLICSMALLLLEQQQQLQQGAQDKGHKDECRVP